jgi:hypothetical protein
VDTDTSRNFYIRIPTVPEVMLRVTCHGVSLNNNISLCDLGLRLHDNPATGFWDLKKKKKRIRVWVSRGWGLQGVGIERAAPVCCLVL